MECYFSLVFMEFTTLQTKGEMLAPCIFQVLVSWLGTVEGEPVNRFYVCFTLGLLHVSLGIATQAYVSGPA